MPDLSNYTGKPLNAFAIRFIHALEAQGFTVAPTSQGPVNGERKTLRIFWRGIYIGQMKADLWGRKIPYSCLYRFAQGQEADTVAKAPFGFDKDEFARQHGCDRDRLHVYRDGSGSYLWIQDEATGLRLMQDWARKIDAIFLGPK